MISFLMESAIGTFFLVAIAVCLAKEAQATPVPQNTIYLLQDQKGVPLLIPQKAFWVLKNDKTERPGVGETESVVKKNKEHVTMQGFLASLPGNWGRVGFSLIETAITKPVHHSQGIRFKVKGTEGVWASVLVKDRQAHQPEGTLTFQWDLELHQEAMEYEAPWSEFTATIRGKKVSGFELDLFSVSSLAFQVSRSQQKKWYETVPLEFELEL